MPIPSPAEAAVRLVGHQVIQRDRGSDTATVRLDDGTTRTLPVGGPYEVRGDGGALLAEDVLVGDLWILAGQSNMVGEGLPDAGEEPSPAVHHLDRARRWRPAVEPPGLGLSFGRTYHQVTGVPAGLVAAAHSGSTLAQWSPHLAGDEGSLYAFLQGSLRAAGGRVAGVLWYQGENEACSGIPATWGEEMAALQQALRRDAGDAGLPFFHVQLGRFAGDLGVEGERRWSRMREQQRHLPAAGMASAVDLDLDDYVHISTAALRRLGRRLGRLAAGAAPSLRLRSITVENDGSSILVAYDGVSGRLVAGSRVAGFSLHDESGALRPAVVHAAVTPEGDAVRIRLTRTVDAHDHLAYGYGMDPQVSLRDEADMSAPAFGPLPLTSTEARRETDGR